MLTYIYETDCFFGDIGVVNLHPSEGPQSVCYIHEYSFDSYGCVCPKKLSRFIIKQNRHRLHFQYKIQGLTSKRDSYCAIYCLHKTYLTKVVGIEFEPAALNLYYQGIS